MPNTTPVAVANSMTCILRDLTSPIRVQRFVVVGKYSRNRPFVRHAAILNAETEFKGECKVILSHVGPPIENQYTGDCHIVGQIGLSNEEIEAVADWLASIETQYTPTKILRFQQYVVAPHMVWVKSEEGRPLRQRFSCVGYVIEAYAAANVSLIDSESLPDAEMKDVETAYPDLYGLLDNPKLAKRLGFKGLDDLGLVGPGPWKVALPGYLFHSTNRFEQAQPRPNPFAPSSLEQSCFPVREPIPSPK